MPEATEVADMLRADLAEARRSWLGAAKNDPNEYHRRTQADFLVDVNHDGQAMDFHSLRHSCGARLAMTECSWMTVHLQRQPEGRISFQEWKSLVQGD